MKSKTKDLSVRLQRTFLLYLTIGFDSCSVDTDKEQSREAMAVPDLRSPEISGKLFQRRHCA